MHILIATSVSLDLHRQDVAMVGLRHGTHVTFCRFFLSHFLFPTCLQQTSVSCHTCTATQASIFQAVLGSVLFGTEIKVELETKYLRCAHATCYSPHARFTSK